MTAFVDEEIGLQPLVGAAREPRADQATDEPTWIGVDLDGHDATSHDRYRADRGAWAEAVATLEQARRLGIATRVLTHVRQHDAAHLGDIARLVRRLGVRRWTLSFSPPASDTNGDAPVPDEAMASVYARVARARRALDRTTLAFEATDGLPCVCGIPASRLLCAALAESAAEAQA